MPVKGRFVSIRATVCLEFTAIPGGMPPPACAHGPRDTDRLPHLAQGLSHREVAATLFLSHRTIDFHLIKSSPKTGITSTRRPHEVQSRLMLWRVCSSQDARASAWRGDRGWVPIHRLKALERAAGSAHLPDG